MSQEIILRTNDLSKYFGGVRALHQINLAVVREIIFGIIGPNGSGKTTLFNVLTGFNPPTSGYVEFENKKITGVPVETIISYGIARTFQNPRLFSELSVLDNVLIGMHLKLKSGVFPAITRSAFFKKEEEDAVFHAMEILKFIGMDHLYKEEAGNLPYGMQKKLEIARGLASMPSLLLLDEPAAGMNPDEVDDLVNVIAKIQEKKITIIVIEHNMRLIMNIAQEIMVLNFGETIAQGTPEKIQTNPEVIQAYLGKRG